MLATFPPFSSNELKEKNKPTTKPNNTKQVTWKGSNRPKRNFQTTNWDFLCTIKNEMSK